MKQFLSILLSLLMLCIAMKEIAIYGLFKINQETITQQCCINIDKPQLACNATCFLNQKIVAAASSEQNAPTSTLLKVVPTFRFIALKNNSFSFDISTTIPPLKRVLPDVLLPKNPFIQSIFQPPEIA